jgi:hypothetical protein
LGIEFLGKIKINRILTPGRYCNIKFQPGDSGMSKHILIVDDDALLHRSLAFHLEQAGYKPLTAANAEDALGLARRDPPELVSLDISLPRCHARFNSSSLPAGGSGSANTNHC